MRLIILIGISIYLGIGAMLHALFVGAQFDWSSAWTFGWLLGWPIMGIIAFLAFGVALFVIIWPIMLISDWNEKRQARQRLVARRQKQ